MPRRHVLTLEERTGLLAFPTSDEGLIQHYTFSEADLSIIRQRRGNPNRFGFASQLCYLRYPGIAMPTDAKPPPAVLAFIGKQLRLEPELWTEYAERAETRREHLTELQAWLSIRPFAKEDYLQAVTQLTELAQQTDRGIVLAEAVIELLRTQHILIPSIDVIERICSEVRTLGIRHVHAALTAPLSPQHRQDLDTLLSIREGTAHSVLMWVRQPPGPPKPKHILRHLERLKALIDLGLPEGLEQAIHQNRLLKLAREGGQMTSQHLRDLEPARRYATLVAVVLDARATLIDEIIDLHDHILGSLFSRAKRTHAEQFQQSGKSINDKVRMYSRIGRALLDAKQAGTDPFAAIERIIPWSVFTKSITEAEHLVQPEDFDFLPLIISGFNQLRRYTPIMLEALSMQAAPAARSLMAAVEVIKSMNRSQARTVKVPSDAPRSFVRKRWKALVHTPKGLDRRFYELCVLSSLITLA